MDFEERFYGQRSRGKRKDSGIIRGFPPTFFGCWINRDIKVRALDKYATSQTDLVQYIGITSDESRRTRAKAYNKRDSVFKFPLVSWGWTGADCTRYLDSIGLTHPLKGLRTGCWVCPKQTKESMKYLYTDCPELWQRLRKYDADDIYGFSDNYDLDELEHEFEDFERCQTRLDKF